MLFFVAQRALHLVAGSKSESPGFASQPHPALCEFASTLCATVAMQVLRLEKIEAPA